MLGAHMESEIREQPRLLAENSPTYFDALKPLQGRQFDLALLAARGSSDNAALYARYLIEIHLGIPVVLAAPSVFTRYGANVRYPKTLCIGISQSGAAPDVSEVIARLRAQGATTLAITNTAGSRLTEEAEHTLLLNVEREKSVAATKTYTASLLALYQVVRALGGNLPDPTGSLPDQAWIDRVASAAEAQTPVLNRSTSVFTLARGYAYATALETAIKLMECALIPAKGFSWADFQHGPTALAVANTAAITFGSVGDGLEERGCHILRSPEAPCPEELAPIWEILFGQFVALNASRTRGLDADTPPNLRKVTETH